LSELIACPGCTECAIVPAVCGKIDKTVKKNLIPEILRPHKLGCLKNLGDLISIC
jgi:hypothetical protein